ncbi:MAG: hypothetical protein M3Q44_00970 [bacterium]|nr:hypothetical protein [bacterium]
MSYTGVSPWKDTGTGKDLDRLESFSGFKTPSRLSEEFPSRHGERRLSYDDMPPSVYGDNSGVAMHRSRMRYILTSEGQLHAINENGIARDMSDQELNQFKAEIDEQLSAHPDNSSLVELYKRFPDTPKK